MPRLRVSGTVPPLHIYARLHSVGRANSHCAACTCHCYTRTVLPVTGHRTSVQRKTEAQLDSSRHAMQQHFPSSFFICRFYSVEQLQDVKHNLCLIFSWFRSWPCNRDDKTGSKTCRIVRTCESRRQRHHCCSAFRQGQRWIFKNSVAAFLRKWNVLLFHQTVNYFSVALRG